MLKNHFDLIIYGQADAVRWHLTEVEISEYMKRLVIQVQLIK